MLGPRRPDAVTVLASREPSRCLEVTTGSKTLQDASFDQQIRLTYADRVRCNDNSCLDQLAKGILVVSQPSKAPSFVAFFGAVMAPLRGDGASRFHNRNWQLISDFLCLQKPFGGHFSQFIEHSPGVNQVIFTMAVSTPVPVPMKGKTNVFRYELEASQSFLLCG